MNTNQFFSQKKNHKLLVGAFLLVLFFWQTQMFLRILSDIFALLAPFLLAGAIAFVVNVPMSYIEKKLFNQFEKKTPTHTKKSLKQKLARPVSLILALLFCILIIAFAIFVVVPQVQETITTLAINLETFAPQARDYVINLFNNNQEIEAFLLSINLEQIKSDAIDFLKAGILSVFGSTINIATSAIALIARLFVAIVFALYLLLQKESLSRQCTKLIFAFAETAKATKIVRVFSLIQKAFSNFIAGQCLEALILTSLMVLVLSICKIPFAILIAVVVGFTSIIPIVGAFFGAGFSAFILLIENPLYALYFLIIFIIIQQIEGNLIYPKVVGDSIGLDAIWVLAAVSIGGTILGVTGILLGIPLASVAYTLLKETVNERLKEKEAIAKE